MFQQFYNSNAVGASIDDIIDVIPPIVEYTVCSTDFEQDSDWTWEDIIFRTGMFDCLERRLAGQGEEEESEEEESVWDLDIDADAEEYTDDQFDRDFAYNRQFALEYPPDEETVKAYDAALARAIATTLTEDLFNSTRRK